MKEQNNLKLFSKTSLEYYIYQALMQAVGASRNTASLGVPSYVFLFYPGNLLQKKKKIGFGYQCSTSGCPAACSKLLIIAVALSGLVDV